MGAAEEGISSRPGTAELSAGDAGWFVMCEGNPIGPFTVNELKANAAAGTIGAADLVREGNRSWVPAKDVLFLASHFRSAAGARSDQPGKANAGGARTGAWLIFLAIGLILGLLAIAWAIRPSILPSLVDGAIEVLAGVCGTLLGYRVVGKPPGLDPKYDARHNRFGRWFKVGGPLLVLFGLYMAITGIVRETARPPADWKRYAADDGSCSAEFPRPPTRDASASSGMVTHRMALPSPHEDRYYSLSVSDLPDGAPPASDEERLDALRDGFPGAQAQRGTTMELKREERITANGIAGRDLEYATTNGLCVKVRCFVKGRQIYHALAVLPQGDRNAEEPARFLASVRLE